MRRSSSTSTPCSYSYSNIRTFQSRSTARRGFCRGLRRRKARIQRWIGYRGCRTARLGAGGVRRRGGGGATGRWTSCSQGQASQLAPFSREWLRRTSVTSCYESTKPWQSRAPCGPQEPPPSTSMSTMTLADSPSHLSPRSIRNRLTKLKKDRTEYIRARDVLDIYSSLMGEGAIS